MTEPTSAGALSRYRLALACLETDPRAAVDHANAALSLFDLDAPELPGVVALLAHALERAGMFAEVVDLARSCESRWPSFVELQYRKARALRKLGRHVEMFEAFEACLATGDASTPPGLPGAGTWLPLIALGEIAEEQGDADAARVMYERSGPHGAERLRALGEPAARVLVPGVRPLTVVACIPGREFSGRFFDAWHAFTEKCAAVGVKLILSRRHDAVVYYARNKVAGGDVRRGPKQDPWGGEIDYDFMLWIDSDVIFRFEDFQALLRHKVDMVAGLYLMADNARFSAVEKMTAETFAKQGEFEFLTPAKTAHRRGLIPVDYCGFGFVLVRRGVFEKLEYPWFRPIYLEMGECTDFTSEDVGFCMLAKQAGIQMMVDPQVVVGHEKMVVLQPAKVASPGIRAA